jgi:acyl carrier protein
VSGIVARVLGQPEVAAGASLLDLGANSIDMVRIVNALERELGFRPRVDEFYRQPSVAWLSDAYERSRGGAASALPDVSVAVAATQADPLPAEPAGSAPQPADAAELAAVARALEQVRGLSADELERLLAQARRRSGEEEQA